MPTAGCTELLPDRTEALVRDVIEADWNGQRVSLVLGDVHFKGPTWTSACQPNIARGEMCLDQLSLYRGIESLGFLTVEDERDLSRNFSGWDDWHRLTQAGIIRTARIALTSTGRERYDPVEAFGRGVIEVAYGTGAITRIVSIDSLVGTATRFLVVQGTHNW